MKYVGITQQDVKTRWLSGQGYRKQSHFWRAIQKYGWDGFSHEVVAIGLSKDEAGKMEIALIEKYKTRDNRFGYNKSIGGDSGARGVVKTERQRKTSAEIMRKRWDDPKYREKMRHISLTALNTPEVIEKRANALRGRKRSAESRLKMSLARTGIKTGPFTDEHKRNIKENHAGGAKPRSVRCVDTGAVYHSINDAARALGINKKQISGCCRGIKHYNTAGGYKWEFEG